APASVSIVREELKGPMKESAAQGSSAHDLRGRLQKLGLSLQLTRQFLRVQRTQEADQALEKAQSILEDLERDLTGSGSKKAAPETRKRRYRTLVVEDDCNQRELLASLLKLSGCDCDSAADGDAALEYLHTHERPDFVLLDMRMPRRNGAETLK